MAPVCRRHHSHRLSFPQARPTARQRAAIQPGLPACPPRCPASRNSRRSPPDRVLRPVFFRGIAVARTGLSRRKRQQYQALGGGAPWIPPRKLRSTASWKYGLSESPSWITRIVRGDRSSRMFTVSSAAQTARVRPSRRRRQPHQGRGFSRSLPGSEDSSSAVGKFVAALSGTRCSAPA